MRLMPSYCQAQLRVMRNTVDGIANRQRADMPNDGTSAMTSMSNKMSLWLTHVDGEETFFGRRAMEMKFNELLEMEAQDMKMTLAHLEPLNTFSWLLTPSQEEKVTTWRTAVMSKNIGSAHAVTIEESGITDAQRAAVVAFTG